MTEQYKPELKEAIYDNHLVRVVGDINPAQRVKIQWDGGANGLIERYVDFAELTLMEEAIPQQLHDLARRIHSGAPMSHMRMFAMHYLHLLRKIHAENQEGRWFRVFNEINAPQSGRLRSDCAVLWRNHLIEANDGTLGCADYQVSKLGCDVIGVEYKSLIVAETPAAAVAETATRHRPIEIKTLMQPINEAKAVMRSDVELAEHLADRWRVLDLTIVATNASMPSMQIQRVVTLQRWPEETTPQPQARAVAAATAPQRTVEPIGPAVIITPTRQPEPVLNLGPYGRSIRDNGLDETLDIADQAAASAGRTAYEQALSSNPIITRPLIAAPAGADGADDND